ncbi:hypothetical protein SAMN05216303_104364 [Rhodoferax sp. OV413]|uniref:hypothetical protein n=1 Tax=Rhodoferax sp. OV413 TaxID=1855285 RepID=UPI000886DC80|nr:hypothetical protein [Rhodoferax sp. OV413]SDP46370.1 hypothetical protein SAMN05216303_104364 [Rhodoferax sp. OV413]
MLDNQLEQPTNKLADQAAATADSVIKSTQRVANDTLDHLANTVHGLRAQAAPLLNRASEQASALLQQSKEAVQDSSAKVKAQAQRASDSTLNYIKDEPVKAVLIAAVIGAGLAALVHLAGRSRDDI